jgi:hypothetical protein
MYKERAISCAFSILSVVAQGQKLEKLEEACESKPLPR